MTGSLEGSPVGITLDSAKNFLLRNNKVTIDITIHRKITFKRSREIMFFRQKKELFSRKWDKFRTKKKNLLRLHKKTIFFGSYKFARKKMVNQINARLQKKGRGSSLKEQLIWKKHDNLADLRRDSTHGFTSQWIKEAKKMLQADWAKHTASIVRPAIRAQDQLDCCAFGAVASVSSGRVMEIASHCQTAQCKHSVAHCSSEQKWRWRWRWRWLYFMHVRGFARPSITIN